MRAGEAVRTVEGSEVPAVEDIHDSIASLDLVIPSGTSRLHPAVHVPNHHSHRVAGLVQFHSALVRCGWRCGDEGTIPVLLRELLDQRALASATEPNYSSTARRTSMCLLRPLRRIERVDLVPGTSSSHGTLAS